MAAGVRLDVLGGFALRVDGQECPPPPPKTRGLLAVLALEQGRPVGRERLGELLWPGGSPRQVGGSLREALYQLRKTLRPHAVVADRAGALVLDGAVRTDLAVFRSLAEADDPAGMWRAADAYGGPLLDGVVVQSEDFADWLATARAGLQRRALSLLGRLADALTAAGDAQGALAAAERMFAIDRLDEAVHLRLLEACRAAGRRADGLRRYGEIEKLLRRELDASPGSATRQLARQLRQEMVPEPALPDYAIEPVTKGRPPPIAVLPFTHLGGDPVPTHLSDGLMVDISCQLAGLRELQVISHGSTLGYRTPGLDSRRVGQELGARYVVRGSVRRNGDHLRLATEMVDAGSGAVVWARTQDTTAELGFADQDRLVAHIVGTLAPMVRANELIRIRGQRPERLSAYDKVLLAREHLLVVERDSFVTARQLLDAAILEEPSYAEAYALSAEWHSLFLNQGWTGDRQAAVAETERLARQAMALDADNVRALTQYGHRRALFHRDYDGAKALFGRALDAGPCAAAAWMWSSYTFAYAGDGEEAVRRAARALELSPRDRDAHAFFSALCVAHYTAGDFPAAADWGRKALAEPSVLSATLGWTAAALAASGRRDEAIELAHKAVAAIPGRRVRDVVEVHPYQDPIRRAAYGAHLVAAGFPP